MIATVVVVVLNADTLASGRVLWRDDAVRSAVVKQAETTTDRELNDVKRGRGEEPRPTARLEALDG